ncbi:hypothetical protein BX666DRAFT_1969777 [Dichotomocladium elegans]|nr:hypothetical protein BX666DRAFT_1969777 [Dichotomocladium elegans]
MALRLSAFVSYVFKSCRALDCFQRWMLKERERGKRDPSRSNRPLSRDCILLEIDKQNMICHIVSAHPTCLASSFHPSSVDISLPSKTAPFFLFSIVRVRPKSVRKIVLLRALSPKSFANICFM